jgi:outer membrane lipoprotein-sorting protein
MKKFSQIFITILILFSMPVAGIYMQSDTDQLLKSLQDKFNSISDFSADFRQSTDGKVNLAGKFFYGKGNKLRLELRTLVIVTDGKTNWSFNKKENKVIISNYDPSDPSILSIEKIIDDYPSRCSINSGMENNTNVLTLSPNKPGLNFKTAKLFVSSNNMVYKILITDPNGALIQIDLTNYKINKNPDNSIFTFTAPKGSKVIDLR